jgi:hypothetical protein
MSDASANGVTRLGSAVRDTAVGHREKLQAALGSVEAALAAPAPGRLSAWTLALRADMAHLQREFGAHVRITEGPDGLYEEILARAPHLAHALEAVRGEHAEITRLLDDAMAMLEHEPIGIGSELDPMTRVEEIRTACTTILGRLVRHRQRGADLTHQAYQVDVGGDG